VCDGVWEQVFLEISGQILSVLIQVAGERLGQIVIVFGNPFAVERKGQSVTVFGNRLFLRGDSRF